MKQHKESKRINVAELKIITWNFLKTAGAYQLAKKSGNFGLKSNGKVIFRKIRSEIVDYLQR